MEHSKPPIDDDSLNVSDATLGWLCGIAILLALAFGLANLDAAPRRKTEPLNTAWQDLVASEERASELEAMSSAQRYVAQMTAITDARKKVRSKTYSVRLRCTGVIEPTQGDRRVLVHGQYTDDDHRDTFGKDATVGIWTLDYKTALALKPGDEFELQGKIFYEVFYLDNDVGRVPSEWQQSAVNTSVAFLDYHLTHWVRPARIYMKDPAIVLLEQSSNLP